MLGGGIGGEGKRGVTPMADMVPQPAGYDKDAKTCWKEDVLIAIDDLGFTTVNHDVWKYHVRAKSGMVRGAALVVDIGSLEFAADAGPSISCLSTR
jgi:hypothetical protein